MMQPDHKSPPKQATINNPSWINKGVKQLGYRKEAERLWRKRRNNNEETIAEYVKARWQVIRLHNLIHLYSIHLLPPGGGNSLNKIAIFIISYYFIKIISSIIPTGYSSFLILEAVSNWFFWKNPLQWQHCWLTSECKQRGEQLRAWASKFSLMFNKRDHFMEINRILVEYLK